MSLQSLGCCTAASRARRTLSLCLFVRAHIRAALWPSMAVQPNVGQACGKPAAGGGAHPKTSRSLIKPSSLTAFSSSCSSSSSDRRSPFFSSVSQKLARSSAVEECETALLQNVEHASLSALCMSACALKHFFTTAMYLSCNVRIGVL